VVLGFSGSQWFVQEILWGTRVELMQFVLHSIPPSMLALLFQGPAMTGSGHNISCTVQDRRPEFNLGTGVSETVRVNSGHPSNEFVIY
jgi:hypothetical protein